MDRDDTRNQVDNLKWITEQLKSVVHDIIFIYICYVIEESPKLRLCKSLGSEPALLVVEYVQADDNKKIARRLSHIIDQAEDRVCELEELEWSVLSHIQCNLLESDDCPKLQGRLGKEVIYTFIYISYLLDVCSNPAQVLKYAEIEEINILP